MRDKWKTAAAGKSKETDKGNRGETKGRNLGKQSGDKKLKRTQIN